jgi:hypothetical protein
MKRTDVKVTSANSAIGGTAANVADPPVAR